MRNLIVIAIAASLAGCGQQGTSSPPADSNAAAPEGAPTGKGADLSHKGQLAPDAAFHDPSGEDVTLGDFRGKPVLVNLWATWCAPCVKELPTLDKLAAERPDLPIVAVSQDNGPQPSVVAFLKKLNVAKLGPYQDPEMKLSGALNAQILPTTILYDASGNEVWRYVGDLDWTGPEAARLLAQAGPSGGGGAH